MMSRPGVKQFRKLGVILCAQVPRDKSFQGKRDKAGSKSPISCAVTPGNSYKFSITIWTETGIGEYEVEVSRIKGGGGVQKGRSQ